MVELPLDWDTTIQPYIAVTFGSGSNTAGTVILNAAVACSKGDGSVTTDPAFNTADALATKTMAAATRGWSTSIQMTQVTSGNNCVPGGTMIIQITRATDTASSAINVQQALITIPRLLTVQAN
jgi:RAB protein geranylgeranyltransferase component A